MGESSSGINFTPGMPVSEIGCVAIRIAACLNEDEAEKVMGCGSTAPASFFVLHKSKNNKIENGHLHDILILYLILQYYTNCVKVFLRQKRKHN